MLELHDHLTETPPVGCRFTISADMISVTNKLAGTCPIHEKDLETTARETFKTFTDANTAVSELVKLLTARPEAANFKFFVTFTKLKSPGELETVAGAHWDALHDGTWTTKVENDHTSGVLVITWIKA